MRCSVSVMLEPSVWECFSLCGFRLALAEKGLYERSGRQKWNSNHFPGRATWLDAVTDADVQAGVTGSTPSCSASCFYFWLLILLTYSGSWPTPGLSLVDSLPLALSMSFPFAAPFQGLNVLLGLPGWLLSRGSSDFLLGPPLAQPFLYLCWIQLL